MQPPSKWVPCSCAVAFVLLAYLRFGADASPRAELRGLRAAQRETESTGQQLLRRKDEELEQLRRDAEGRERLQRQRDMQLRRKDQELEQLRRHAEGREELLLRKDEELARKDEELAQKDQELDALRAARDSPAAADEARGGGGPDADTHSGQAPPASPARNATDTTTPIFLVHVMKTGGSTLWRTFKARAERYGIGDTDINHEEPAWPVECEYMWVSTCG